MANERVFKQKLAYTSAKAIEMANEIALQSAKQGKNLRLFRDSNLFLSIISKITNKSTSFENMDFLEVNGEIDVIYKSWEIPIVSSNEAGFDSFVTLIIPYITYNILYESITANAIDFYTNQYNLKQTQFFEIRDNTLYLKVSSYLKRYFDSPSLVVPRAKILIHFKNPFQVAH